MQLIKVITFLNNLSVVFSSYHVFETIIIPQRYEFIALRVSPPSLLPQCFIDDPKMALQSNAVSITAHFIVSHANMTRLSTPTEALSYTSIVSNNGYLSIKKEGNVINGDAAKLLELQPESQPGT